MKKHIRATLVLSVLTVCLFSVMSCGQVLAASPAYLENPSNGGKVSGIGLVSGWACDPSTVEISFNGGARVRVPSGGSRLDTANICGHPNTGFGLTFAYNLLGNGTHTAQLYVGGVEVGSKISFTVTVPAGEFIRGQAKTVSVPDFPSPGVVTQLEWQESSQNFVISGLTQSSKAFPSTPLLLPDLKQKYDKLCGRNVNAQQIIPIDLNKDGRKDLIVAAWCPQDVLGQNVDTPVKNTLIALIQNVDGTFFDATAQVFGLDMPDIGGVPNAHTAYDFNNDGFTDIVFAVNREDGRSGTGSMENFKSRQMSLMSNGNGTYRLVPIGDLKYGMNVTTRTNSFNSRDIIFHAFHSVRSGYRWTGYEWLEVSGYNEWVNDPLFLNSIPNIAVQPGPRDQLGIDLFSLTNNSWIKTSSFSFAGSTIWVDQISSNGSIGKVPIITINGQDYITPGFAKFCEIKSGTATKIIAFMYGTVIEGGYRGGVIREGNDPVYKYKAVNKLLTFNVFGTTLSKDALELDLSNEPSHLAFYDMKCDDTNGDGIPDIHVMAPLGWSGNPAPYPILFLGQPGFTFKRVRSDVFPSVPNGGAVLIFDMDGDNVADLVYWPLDGYTGSDSYQGNDALIRSDSVRYKFYKGLRNFYSSDLN